MGQVALGFRSLLIKAAVFFVMAALLAWALGGTLWPRAEIVQLEPVSFAGRQWFWQLTVGGRRQGEMRWTMMIAAPGEDALPVDDRTWAEIADPVLTADSLIYGGRRSRNAAEPWRLEVVTGPGDSTSMALPDRLAVERQLARARAGLPLEDPATLQGQRDVVLNPSGNAVEEQGE